MSKLRVLPGVLSALLAGALHAAPAPNVPTQSGYYVVVPVGPARAAMAAEGINVSLAGQPLPVGLVGLPYDGFNFMKLLTVTGDASYTGYGVKWEVLTGTLPDGLLLNADGTVSGTPTTTGTANFTLRATYKTKSGESAYELVVARIVVDIASGSPPQAIVGQAYSYDLKPLLTVSGDPAYAGTGVTWSVVSSSLPAGLALRTDGTISGTPSANGSGTVVARATYRSTNGEQTFEVVTLAIKVALAASTPPQAIVGQDYVYDLKPLLSVSGDRGYTGAGVTWTALSDNLPAGLSLRPDGTIAGAPSAAGSGFITVRAAYRGVNDQQAYEVITLAINVALNAATPPQAIVGQAYSYDLKPLLKVTGDNAYNGSGVTWTVVSNTLPTGLYLKNDGTIGGTPTASGNGTIIARATYRGVNGQQTYQVVTLGIKVTLAAGTPPQAIVGQAYSYDLKPLLSVGGDPAYDGSGVTWSVVSSTLPAGLYLKSDGTLAGTATAAGTGRITARASYRGENGDQVYQVVSLNIVVTLTTATPPQAIVGQTYSYDLKPLLSVTGDSAYAGSGVTWSTVAGTLPAGLALQPDGTISGTPSAAGTGTITARAAYRGVNGQQNYQVVSLNITVALAAGSPPEAIVGQAYIYDIKPLLSVSGDGAYNGSGITWSVVSSSLPAGLTLRADGTISGTPSASGTGSLTARATYRGVNGQQAYQVVTLGISVNLAAGSPPQAIVGQSYTYDLKPLLSVSGDSSYNGLGVTWSVVNSTLPAGLQLLNSGVISGTPTAGGTGTLTARATYRGVNGDQGYQVVTLNITVSLAAATPPQARVGESYSYDIKQLLTVSGDSAYSGGGVTWSVVSNSLPTGLVLTNSGTIAGTPSTASTGSVTARATYRNVNGQQSYSVTALPAWTYAWTPGNWSTPSACGSTTSSRSMTCIRDDGTTAADASCTSAKPATTQPATDYSACTYGWSSGGWSTPAACGSTTSTRSVSCVRSDGATVADSSCATAKPATTQATTDYSSCSYAWGTTGFSTPSACGATTASRTVYCQRSDGTTVADASCNSGTKPAATSATTDYSSCSYTWNSSGWSTPSACGSVTQTRTVWCQRSDGTTVADASCNSGTKPATSGTTTNYSSCTYSNSYGAYGSCSASCGGGTQTRTATCMRSDGTAVASANCPAPTTSQSCNTQTCYTYGWSTGGWSTPAACGSTTASRSVTCVRSDGASMSDAYCSGAKPSTTTASSDYSACSYSWSTSGWSTPAGCGAVTQTRSATCVRSDGASVSGSYCGAAPATSQTNSDYSACSYSWSYGAFGSCSASCGGGTQSRSATCVRSDGSAVANSYCGTPATSQSCNTQACAVTYTWVNNGSLGCIRDSEAATLSTSGPSGSCTTPGAKAYSKTYVGSCGPGSYLKNQFTCS